MKFKLVKKGLTMAALALVTATNATFVSAMPLESNAPIVSLEKTFDMWDDLEESREITREEFVESYARNNNISFEEADVLVAKQTEKSLAQVPAALREDTSETTITWRQRTWTFTFPQNTNYRATLVVDYEVFVSGSFRQINYAIASSRFSAGIHNASWVQLSSSARAVNHNGTPGNFPTQRLSIMASGYFTSSITNSIGGGASIPGFSVSHTSGNTTHFRSSTFQMQQQYTLG